MMLRHVTTGSVSLALVLFALESADAAEPGDEPAAVRAFVESHCYDCHAGAGAEAELDLSTLGANLDDPQQFARWLRVFDRVRLGEMPPPDYSDVDSETAKGFLESTARWLREHQRQQWEREGRVRGRRLNRWQVEQTLHDLLGIDIPLASQLTEEPRTAGFTTVADGQPMSHVQLERHLAVVDLALEEAFRRALTPPDETSKTFSAKQISRTRPKSRTREPELIEDTAVVWSSRLIFYGRLPATTAPEDGWYRFRIRASALKSPAEHGVWCTVRSGACVSSAPLLAWVGAFEATDEPNEWTFEAWLPKGHMLEVRPGDGTLRMARFAGGQVGTGEGEPQDVPGVAIHSVVMERIHRGPEDEQVRRRLFGDLEVRPHPRLRQARLVSKAPHEEAARLMHGFAERAFRRPAAEAEVAPFVAMVHEMIDDGASLVEALRGGYRALLCSPRFLYFHEEPGLLDDYAIASRLSYLIWNSLPDDALRQLAESGRLTDPQVIRSQVDRMLADRRGRDFISRFAAEWLDLSDIDDTEPDPRLHPGFDMIVQQAMLDETHVFLQTLLDDNLGVDHLIDSDFTFLNSRLARFYGIDGVEGDALRRVALRAEHRRGGMLTHGAILKVTANGTTTSPIIRGVWVAERLLGEHIPPPPENVPAVEPDIRGATTFRELLDKHTSDASCAACHVKIDPPGFALENYDPAGRWRETYPRLKGQRVRPGAAVDASGELADGRRFEDLDGFRKLVLAEAERVARNVAEKLLTYGTGGPVAFADRAAVDEIVDQAADSNFGFRSLLYSVVTSPVFLSK